ncbi:MAG: NTP transferase domain-containing protein [Deltaproteobacteria bacterium]|nr:NTP transferase domain-containing protein [Deltaproteobacteria bacterium]
MSVILLAAGRSSRMGKPKGLVQIENRPWIEWQLESLRAAGAETVVIVLGHDAEAYETALAKIAIAGLSAVTTRNLDPDRGQFSSIQEGLRCALSSGFAAGGAEILPVDVPCANLETWKRMREAQNDRNALVPVMKGRGGHPVWISETFAKSLVLLDPVDPESRLDLRIHRLPAGQVAHVEVDDPAILANFNTESDFPA